MDNENVDALDETTEQEEEEVLEEGELVEENEEVEEETTTENEVTIPKAKFVAMQRKAIAYDANKKQVPKKEDIINNVQADELKLIARGLSDEEIEQAKIIAKGKDITLNESIKDPLFLSYQKELKEAEKREKAKLGASNGSGSVATEKGFTSGLSREEHEKLWQEHNK